MRPERLTLSSLLLTIALSAGAHTGSTVHRSADIRTSKATITVSPDVRVLSDNDADVFRYHPKRK